MGYLKNKYFIFLFALIAVLPVITLRDFTPSNELRYLSIADEAIQNSNLFAFTNQGEPYADKPPLYFWLIMLGKWVAGSHSMWLLSLFAFIPAIIIILLMDRWIEKEASIEVRTISIIMLITAGLFIGSSLTLRMDMLMCLFIVLALRSFWLIYKNEGNRRVQQWLFPIWLFLAVFSKGPLGVLIPLVSTVVFLVYTKRFKTIGAYWGWRTWLVLLGLCALWFQAVYLEGGKEYLDNLLFHQTVDRAVNSFHHNRPFHYYFIAIWYCIAPWSLLIVGALIASMLPKSKRSEVQGFFLVTGLSTFLLLSCISAKLQIYMLPAVPFLIYAAVMYLPQRKNDNLLRIALAFPASCFALAMPAVFIIKGLGNMPMLDNGWIIAASGILSVAGLTSLIFLFRKNNDRRLIQVTGWIGGGLLLAVFTGGWAMSDLNANIGYAAICKAGKELSQKYNTQNYKTWKVSRPENMDVYLGTDIDMVKDEDSPIVENQKYVLLTRNDYDYTFPEKERIDVGPYSAILIDTTDTETNRDE